jgi:hypothetical protein
MSFFEKEAFLKAVTTSLHCLEPGKDAHYDLQMIPAQNQVPVPTSSQSVRWKVVAQYARNGEPFKWVTKCSGVSRDAAKASYRGALQDRLDHGYEVVCATRESDILDAQAQAAKELFAGLPEWPDFLNTVLQTCTYVSQQPLTAGQGEFHSIVLLADLSFSSPEGVTDAILAAVSSPSYESLAPRFSPEVLAWIQTHYNTEGASEVYSQMGNALMELCNQLAAP